ncbi:class I SAM-dependent methyltransferase [Nocardia sp. XZ_19_369]|uniref:class I SAM-dependent methyltransferase n=1 Tax=Nocardia sp. XZ_19_369 TaxID=2769487 RepID=UPI00188F2FFE|nr:class I SAM-dependent methyltransferase [Nocardia sp. XZ_19_369]
MLGDDRVTSAYAQNAKFWIDIVRGQLDDYQKRITDPALLDILGDCRGLKILDAGCGEGYLTRELVRRGAAHVYGVDTCAEFIEAARTHPDARPDTATFQHADVAALPLAEHSVDLVVANRLPNGIANPGKRFHEFARVLRPAGRLIALGMHPCFYTGRVDRDSDDAATIPIDSYFGGRTVEQKFDVAGRMSPVASVQQFYPLETYLRMITTAGFVITDLREPHPSPQQRDEDPWWNQNFSRPLFLLLDCALRT